MNTRPLRHEKARPTKKGHEHLSIVEHTMRDWSDTAHDDLLEVPANEKVFNRSREVCIKAIHIFPDSPS